MTDAVLTQMGVAKALRSMAAISQDIHDPDQALLWAAKQGFIVQGPDRETMTLTQKGAGAVWLFWRAYQASRKAHRGETVDLSEWQNHKPLTGEIIMPGEYPKPA